MRGLKAQRMVHRAKSSMWITITLWVIAISVVIFLVWAQTNLLVPYKTIYKVDYLPKSLVGTKIVHISNLDNSSIDVCKATEAFKPDMILLSGGFRDDNGGYSKSVEQVTKLANIAPTYYVYNVKDKELGNEDFLSGTGAINLTNDYTIITAKSTDAETFIKNIYGDDIINKAINGDEEAELYVKYITEALNNTAGAKIRISGVNTFEYENGVYDALDFMNSVTEGETVDYDMLLMGNIRLITEMQKSHVDAIFTGGTYGTNSLHSWFVKGEYGVQGKQVFISGGVGTPKSIKINDGSEVGIQRIFNFPEIQCITLSDGSILNHNPLEDFIGIFFDDVGNIFENDGGFQDKVYTYDE